MIGQGRPTISARIAAILWLALTIELPAQEVRAPSDSLRVVAKREPLIFAPGEQFTFDLEPQLLGVEPSTTIDIEATLTRARERMTLWSTQQRLPVPVVGPAVATLHVPMPRQEGVYEIRLAVTRPPGFRERFFPGGAGTPLVERSFQVVVLDKLHTPPVSDAQWRTVFEIDPANPAWSTRLPDWTQVRRLPGVPRRPIGSVRTLAVTHPLGSFVELPQTPVGGEPHWQAYPITLESVGTPHMLEVEYPNDREQHLGISIVEPSERGQFASISRDSGVYVEGLGSTERVERHVHRMVFWPRTNSPLVLVTNQHPTAAACFSRIRVSKHATSSLATEPWSGTQPAGRLVAAYLARPIHVVQTDGQPSNDWQDYYDGAVHLTEYLSFAGYNSAVVNVMADGGSILPDEILQSTPLADIRPIGVEHDLPTADGLELLLRVFDRSGLALVPTLEFTTPLPELEALRRGTNPSKTGIELVGPGGRTLAETHDLNDQRVPNYNVLDDRVQKSMLDVASRVVARYADHPAFASLAVRLSGRSFAVLPDLGWGIDDATIARFERDTGIQLSDDGPDRFAVRQEHLMGEHADAWRSWRARRVTRFYQQLADLVPSKRGETRLLLTTEDIASIPEAAEKLRPNVIAKPRFDQAMLDWGIDAQALDEIPGIAILPTRYVESMVPLVDRAVDLAINDANATAKKTSAAAMFYHRPLRRDFTSFDALGSFDPHAQLVIQSVPHGPATRQPYIAALVDHNPAIIVDGGEMSPLGQEDAVRDTRKILRALPTGEPKTKLRQQNVTVQTYVDGEESICVVINECPWQAAVALDVVASAPTDAVPLVGGAAGGAPPAVVEHFNAGRQIWELQLAPYDIHAVRFAATGVRIENIRSQISAAGQQELVRKLAELKDRDLTATPACIGLENPSFEPSDGAHLPGWQLVGAPTNARAELDATKPQHGATCLFLHNSGPGEAAIASNEFATPPTGQLVMWAFVRGENIAPTTELRLVFEVEGTATRYRQTATLGGAIPGAQQLTSEWGYGYAFRREDLPLDSRGRMRVKFELVGPGDVWIDNVQLYDLLFPLKFYERSEPEKLELVKLISAADRALENGELAECVQKLEGYWPRFLTAYTPLAPPTMPQPPVTEDIAPAAPAEQGDETPSVSGWWDIRRLWR